MADELKPADQTPTTRFSLERLSSAFARLMGANKKPPTPRSPAVLAAGTSGADADEEEPPLPVTPRMIVEGLLFVGRADGRGLTLKELAAPIRNVDEAEVETLIAELNAAYAQDESPYEITCVDGAQRLQLRREMDRVKARMRGEVRAAKLSGSAIEVLSIVAYRQPITGDEVNRCRGSRSQSILAQLVQRQLVRVDREPPSKDAAGAKRKSTYATTERFNRLFNVASPADLPRGEDLADN